MLNLSISMAWTDGTKIWWDCGGRTYSKFPSLECIEEEMHKYGFMTKNLPTAKCSHPSWMKQWHTADTNGKYGIYCVPTATPQVLLNIWTYAFTNKTHRRKILESIIESSRLRDVRTRIRNSHIFWIFPSFVSRRRWRSYFSHAQLIRSLASRFAHKHIRWTPG